MPDASSEEEVEWPELDGYQTLYWDHVHFPRPIVQIGLDFLSHWMNWGGRRHVVNGYIFRTHPSFGGFSPEGYSISPYHELPDPTPIWEQETLPHIEAICDRVRELDYESLDIERFVSLLPSVFQACGDAFRLTMNPYSAFNARTARLVSFCEEDLGSGASLQVVTMLQGMTNVSADSGAGLARLADIAAASPPLKAAVAEGRFDAIDVLPEAETFRREFATYLHSYGWRAPTWGELHVPTWAEDPGVPLNLVRRYLSDPEHSPATAMQRARRQRDEAIADTESRLPRAKLALFRTLLQEAEAHVPICEARAMWQLISCGIARIPLLALGRKLAAEGLINQADDIFYFRIAELKSIVAREDEGLKDQADSRRQELALWSRVLPPFSLGAPPSHRIRDWYADPSIDNKVVSGVAASKGVVRARARLIRSLDDMDRLSTGEVLVCPSTAPPWTPLFAFASAVVTDSGGILSHSAISAREYGIPCVVGTRFATQRIPDGAIVTVDGEKGIVRIETE